MVKNSPESITDFEESEILGRLTIQKGITAPQIAEIVTFSSSDPEIIKFTRDRERFKDQKSFSVWLESNPAVYCLTNRADHVLGLAWFRQKPLPEALYVQTVHREKFIATLGIRIYPPARGKRLAVPFLGKSLRDYRQSSPGGIWLSVSPENAAAIKSYNTLGFKTAGELRGSGKIIMVLPE